MKHPSIGFVLSLSVSTAASADFTYFDDVADGWFSAVPEFTTLDFVDLDTGVLAHDAYADLGVLFVDDDPNFVIPDSQIFPIDGRGIDARTSFRIAFDEPAWAFGMHFPGLAWARFFRDGEEVFETPGVGGGGGTNFFEGFTTTEWFDEVELFGSPSIPGVPDDIIFFDNFYFATVPAPGAVSMLALGGLFRRRRG